jgi:two-component system sensor histidine kinase PhoQ
MSSKAKKAPRLLLLNRRSLVGRFFIASLCFVPLFIVLNGGLLLNSFNHSQINAEKENLQTQIYLLLGLAEMNNGKLIMPFTLPEPRLNQLNSGLYAIITNNKHEPLWRSESASLFPESQSPTQLPFNIDQLDFFGVSFRETHLNALSYDIEWVDDEDNSYPLRFIILKDSTALESELNSYQARLWQWLGLLTIALLLIQALMMYWGLRPLKWLSNQLKELQENKIQTLNANYPHEIQPVIDNLNTILKQESQQRERYRNSLADLAHSLKTPLAVINSQLEKNREQENDNTIEQQLDRIDQIISHQLQRAVIRSQKNSINQRGKVAIHPAIERLIQVMKKVYSDKAMTFENLVDTQHEFMGDEADLLEVIGNIMDNACKYGNDHIVIQSTINNQELTIYISDNGAGIPETLQNTLLQRGARADTAASSQSGQGIGLTVAVDIVSSYQGSIDIKNNMDSPHLSGACFMISFPS